MGVPKFFRWLSERYPKINQRQTFFPELETYQRYFGDGDPPPPPLETPDPLSTCGLPPEIDRLYIDTNGVLHGCSHNNGDATGVTQEQIFRNVAYYLDRVISDIVQPKELVFIAIDGVAPRAKLNQQRSRRYRGGEGEMEQSIYEAFGAEEENGDAPSQRGGRIAGKFESVDEDDEEDDDDAFHPNAITPGTEFFQECTKHLEHWIQYKLSTDPRWKNLSIIFSGPNTPGEGEHKIMEFMRHERAKPDYNPNLRHAIMGQDADLIMLGLVTHEPNLCIFRERVIFDAKKRAIMDDMGLDVYIHNCHFEWLHMSVLRDYLMYEFETAPAVLGSQCDRERTIDDFVFLTFFVGNDFLPHTPALDIGDEAFDLIFHVYKQERRKWLKDKRYGKGPYLTKSGNIVSGRRLERFLQALGSHENAYYDNKRDSADKENARVRKQDAKLGIPSTVPSEDILTEKEEADRARYREMLNSLDPLQRSKEGFLPVLSSDASLTTFTPEEEDIEEGFLQRLGSLIQSSISDEADATKKGGMSYGLLDDQDLKGRYYYDKFRFTPFDYEKHRALRKAYTEGLLWNLKYYYEGCVSWSWYYPYHYGPMLSDLIGLEEFLAEISFDDLYGEPLLPFHQLMGCLPPSSSKLLPEPYRWLMTDPFSPISEFYPRSFIVDMNGKRWPWEATVLLPFLDSKRLVQAANEHVKYHMLTEVEQARNQVKDAFMYSHSEDDEVVVPALEARIGNDDYYGAFINRTKKTKLLSKENPIVFEPKILPGTKTPTPGFPTLTYAPIQSLWRRRIGTNVFGHRSKYRTAVLDTATNLPDFPPLEVLAPSLIGTPVYINYPYMMEGYVTALSTPAVTVRGNQPPRQNDQSERELWIHAMNSISKGLEYGEGYSGTGGWRLPQSMVLIAVRPLKEIKTMSDGTHAKIYAKFEVTLPLIAAVWSPIAEDPRTANLLAALEKDPFFTSGPHLQNPALSNKQSKVFPNSQRIEPFSEKPPISHGLEELSGTVNTALLDDLPTKARPSDRPSNTVLVVESSLGSTRSSMVLPPTPSVENTTDAQSNRSFLPPMAGKRQFCSHSVQRVQMQTPSKAYQRMFATTNRSRRTIPSGGNARGRALTLGIAAFVFVGGSIAGVNARNHDLRTHGLILGPALGESIAVPPLEFEHGTTTLSFVFQGGIVAAVDSRASLGNFVGSKTVQKVLPINTHMLGTMAGGAADCSYWIRKLKAEAERFELSSGYRMSVARASKMLANSLYSNRRAGLSVGTMIMGFDPFDGGPRIFYVDNTGARIEGDMFSVGSGSTFALGILDHERRYDMSQEEAIALGVKAIRHATFRDAYSGGFINVYIITKDGWRHVFREDLASSAANMQKEQLHSDQTE